MSYLALTFEIYFALVLGISGLTKLDDFQHFAKTLSQQQLIPPWSIVFVARAFPWMELTIAALLLTDIFPLFVSFITFIIFTVFLAVKIILMLKGYSEDCGCYGSAHVQKVNNTEIITSCFYVGFTVLHLWLVARIPPIEISWRLIAGSIFIAVQGYLVLRMYLKRKQYTPVIPRRFTDLGGFTVGEKAPIFAAVDQQGKTVSLEAFEGHQCLLMFVSPNCSACHRAITGLKQILQDSFHVSALVVTDVDPAMTREFASQFEIDVPFLASDIPLIDLYAIPAYPFTFALDEYLVVQARGATGTYDLLKELVKMAYRKEQLEEVK